MTIQLPDDFVIADSRVEKRNVRIEDSGCASSVNGIRVPVDAAIPGAGNSLVTKKIEPPLHHSVGMACRGRQGSRPLAEHGTAHCRRSCRIEDEARSPLGHVRDKGPLHGGPVAAINRLGAAVTFGCGQDLSNVGTVPPGSTDAHVDAFGNAVQHFGSAPLPFLTRLQPASPFPPPP